MLFTVTPWVPKLLSVPLKILKMRKNINNMSVLLAIKINEI